MNTDTAVLILLADMQRLIEALRAENAGLHTHLVEAQARIAELEAAAPEPEPKKKA